ncbi:uncharacterized protein LOC129582073 isoform X2 [Paramacrobiotus metropolitanus]|uniref:uncharacterized protein LOC129582073 isoform X2 n=1 Tax=Paramacrobiotus metropolitanus TaxID=2943436 RepID=UPI00244580C1|nr:uncharacterized protein LOC129582073 isoform X2 [Paramacrobiotus metropolitanus]
MNDNDLLMSETSEVEDDDAPEDVGFAASRVTAQQQRQQELQASKLHKQERHAKNAKQQAWFHDQKVKALLKPKKSSKNSSKSAPQPDHPPRDAEIEFPANEDTDMVIEEKPDVKKPRRKKPMPLSEDDEPFPDFIPLDKNDEKSASSRSNVRIKSIKNAASLQRPEVLAFARSRFTARNVRRIPASTIASIAAKRLATQRRL